jgi:hypothetical protein
MTMTRSQTVDVLKVVAALDRRKITDADVDVWHACLRDRSIDDCTAAVISHFQTSTEWLMPAHVLRLAKAISQDRYMRQTPAERLEIQLAADAELERRRRNQILEG